MVEKCLSESIQLPSIFRFFAISYGGRFKAGHHGKLHSVLIASPGSAQAQPGGGGREVRAVFRPEQVGTLEFLLHATCQ